MPWQITRQLHRSHRLMALVGAASAS